MELKKQGNIYCSGTSNFPFVSVQCVLIVMVSVVVQDPEMRGNCHQLEPGMVTKCLSGEVLEPNLPLSRKVLEAMWAMSPTRVDQEAQMVKKCGYHGNFLEPFFAFFVINLDNIFEHFAGTQVEAVFVFF